MVARWSKTGGGLCEASAFVHSYLGVSVCVSDHVSSMTVCDCVYVCINVRLYVSVNVYIYGE